MVEDRDLLERVGLDLDEHVALIAREFRDGFEAVERIGTPGVTIFGSARLGPSSPVYQQARGVGRRFSEAGWAVITGGGPGVMEAANRGAQEGGGISVGFNIELPAEQRSNAFTDLDHTFRHFYARKTMLVKAAEGFVLFEGGFGTLDELFESLVLIQTRKIFHFPVVLFGSAHWSGLRGWIDERLIAERLISPDDLSLLTVTDDPAEAVRTVLDCYARKCAELPDTPRVAGRPPTSGARS
jgi:uncharacterized protein (TIGR00730 family)